VLRFARASATARWKRGLAEVLGRAAPRFEVANAIPPGALSHDPQVEVAYRSDPLNAHSTTARLGMELFHEQARVKGRLAQMTALPIRTYVYHGTDDWIVPVWSSDPLEGRGNVTRRVYPGLRHEMHNEPERDAVIGDTLAWIETSLGTTDRGAHHR